MLKLAVLVLLEVMLAITVAGVVLAILVPVLIRYELIAIGDFTGSIVIAGTILVTIGAMLFRPGSAVNRYGKH